jgi:hypothetical protein
VGYCDVLRNREQDLFSNVRDVNTIVFYWSQPLQK